jgi:hypothetical protein
MVHVQYEEKLPYTKRKFPPIFYLEELVVNRNESALLLHVVVRLPQDGNLLEG